MTAVDDGWVELPAVHDPIPWTRFDKNDFSGCEGQRE